MKKIVFIVLAVVIVFFMLFYFIGVYTTNSFIDTRAESLAELAKQSPSQKFTYTEIDSLPVPVQKYFRFAMDEGIAKPRFARLKQSGQFKTNIGADFKDLSADQYSITFQPGFIWSGEIDFAKLIWVKGVDTYFKNSGDFLIKFMSGITITKESGREIAQAQIVRWLLEGLWYPSALLPSKYISWSEIDSSSANIHFKKDSLQIDAAVYFNNDGSIDKIKTKRYMTTTSGPVLTDYTGHFSNYKDVNGIRIPFHGEVEWNLENQDFLYGKFDIEEIEFDVFKKFEN